ncbi:hypothetical protein M0657_008310 [Pyricularia oryzae]|uniref:Uncharacterized protein n=1 Tax=Pyricularia oryzae TaxID=318829 RepID=A0A4P7N4R4_PYROR|nr:hypothetical protein M9X92_008102 [Pyricularia oryzae]KAI7917042.1 hypothetical protein M0657_008310 [Pyricularia oryzae]QBZ56552.1 hypothetical protein PoMZ_01461 [Pyricularia oryzae]
MRVIKLAQFGSTFSAPKVVQSAIIFSRLVLIRYLSGIEVAMSGPWDLEWRQKLILECNTRPTLCVPRPINLLSALRIAEAPVTAFIHISA